MATVYCSLCGTYFDPDVVGSLHKLYHQEKNRQEARIAAASRSRRYEAPDEEESDDDDE